MHIYIYQGYMYICLPLWILLSLRFLAITETIIIIYDWLGYFNSCFVESWFGFDNGIWNKKHSVYKPNFDCHEWKHSSFHITQTSESNIPIPRQWSSTWIFHVNLLVWGCKIVNDTLLRGNVLHLKLIAPTEKYRIEY